jgi:hypothetical protein
MAGTPLSLRSWAPTVLAALAVCAALPGCESRRADALVVQIIAPDETNPTAGRGPGTLRVRVDQNGVVRTAEAEVRGETFDLVMPIASYVAPARIQAELELERGLSIGAVPFFLPIAAGFVRVVVGAPGTCAGLVEPRLADPRIDAALVGVDANLLLVGGTTALEGGIGHDRIGVLGAIHLTWEGGYSEDILDRFTAPLRATRAARLGATDRILAISETRTDAVIYDLGLHAAPRETSVPLHPGAGAGSALADLGAEGIAIVGGGTEDAPASAITWIDVRGTATTTALAIPRARPAAIRIGEGIVIAGGQSEGAPLFEYARLRDRGVPIAGTEGPTRRAPILVRDPSARTALLLGGADASGLPDTRTWLVTGCPAACSVVEGPAWERARLSPAIAETGRSTFLLGGTAVDPLSRTLGPSAAVDEVVIVGGAISLETFGDLDRPRERAAAAHLESGVVVVVGGRVEGGGGASTITLCWPNALEPWRR